MNGSLEKFKIDTMKSPSDEFLTIRSRSLLSIKKVSYNFFQPLTFKWGFDFENFLLPFTDVSKKIPLQAKVSIMKLIPTASVRQQQLLNLLDQLSHPFPDYLVEFMKTMLPAGRAEN